MTNAALGMNIKSIRLKLGISQNWICESIGKPKGWLSKRENGRVLISISDLIDITKVLHIPASSVFTHS